MELVLDGEGACDLDDRELWQTLKAGHKQALEFLFNRHYADLFRYAFRFCGNRQMAEDHIQGLFLKIWDRRNHLSNVISVKTYLWTALRRSIIASRQKEEKEREAFLNSAHQSATLNFSIEDVIIRKEGQKETLQLLHKAINNLNGRQKEILYLKYFEGLGYDEIEQITGLHYQTIRNYVCESIKILKESLANENQHLSYSAINVLLLMLAEYAGFWG